MGCGGGGDGDVPGIATGVVGEPNGEHRHRCFRGDFGGPAFAIHIYLDEEQTASLDKLAAQEGVSRAELIRLLLNRALTTAGDDLASDLQAINDSFGTLRHLDPPVRRSGGREQHLAQVWRATS